MAYLPFTLSKENEKKWHEINKIFIERTHSLEKYYMIRFQRFIPLGGLITKRGFLRMFVELYFDKEQCSMLSLDPDGIINPLDGLENYVFPLNLSSFDKIEHIYPLELSKNYILELCFDFKGYPLDSKGEESDKVNNLDIADILRSIINHELHHDIPVIVKLSNVPVLNGLIGYELVMDITDFRMVDRNNTDFEFLLKLDGYQKATFNKKLAV